MSPDNQAQNNKYIKRLKSTGSFCISRCKYFLLTHFIPRSARCVALGKSFCINKLIPCLYLGTRLVKHEFIRIHEKQNWFQRCGATFAGNAIGLSMAMLSTKVVEHFVEVRDISNLWGILASRPVVSETTYEIFSFAAEFVIALMVFTLTEHYYEEFRQFRKRSLDINTSEIQQNPEG